VTPPGDRPSYAGELDEWAEGAGRDALLTALQREQMMSQRSAADGREAMRSLLAEAVARLEHGDTLSRNWLRRAREVLEK
jgi:hypothetical protein